MLYHFKGVIVMFHVGIKPLEIIKFAQAGQMVMLLPIIAYFPDLGTLQ